MKKMSIFGLLIACASCQKEMSVLDPIIPEKEMVVLMKYPSAETIIDANNVASVAYTFVITVKAGKQAVFLAKTAIRADSILARNAFCLSVVNSNAPLTSTNEGTLQIDPIQSKARSDGDTYVVGVDSTEVFELYVRYRPAVPGGEYRIVLPYMKYGIVLGNSVIRALTPRNIFQTQFIKIE